MDANWRRDAIIELLHQRGKVKAQELADCFQVTRQTIYQDVSILSTRYALCSERGKNGGIYLITPCRNRKRCLSSTQVEVLQHLVPVVPKDVSLVLQSILNDFGTP